MKIDEVIVVGGAIDSEAISGERDATDVDAIAYFVVRALLFRPRRLRVRSIAI